MVVEQTYTTPYEHNNPMEPHAHRRALGRREDGPILTSSTPPRACTAVAQTLAPLLGLEPEQVRVRRAVRRRRVRQQGPAARPEVAAVLAAQTHRRPRR